MNARSQQFQMLANGECRKTASCGVFVDSLLLIVCQEVATKVCYCCYEGRSFKSKPEFGQDGDEVCLTRGTYGDSKYLNGLFQIIKIHPC